MSNTVNVRMLELPKGGWIQVIGPDGVASFPAEHGPYVSQQIRKLSRPPSTRAYQKFPWPPAAIAYAVKLAILHEGEKGQEPITFRTIAAELHARGFVRVHVDPATVRRLVISQIGKERAAR